MENGSYENSVALLEECTRLLDEYCAEHGVTLVASTRTRAKRQCATCKYLVEHFPELFGENKKATP